MAVDMPKIPGGFPWILQEMFEATVSKGLGAYIRAEAEKYERTFTQQLKAAVPGDDFLGQKVTRVDAAADRATLQVTLSPQDVPGVPGLRLGAAKAEFLVERWINLTDSSKPPIKIIETTSFSIQLELSKKENYELKLGYAQDDSIANQTRIIFASVDWKNPQFRLLGLLGRTDKGGILIDVEGESPAAIPLGGTPSGLKGIGLLYGEHFAPLLPGAVPGNAMDSLGSADAGAYAVWAQTPKNLATWIAVPDDINLYGISATLVDMGSSGGLARLEKFGLAYITYGPTIILTGELRVLEKIDGGRTIGVIDLRSRSVFARGSQTIDVIPWEPGALIAEGNIEVSASLTDDRRTYIAIGGYAMNGCSMKLLEFLELKGGVRVVPAQGIAARAVGRISAEGNVAGFSGGYNFWIDISGGLGWNPVALESRLEIGGVIWIKALDKRLSLGAWLISELYLQKPLIFRMKVNFEIKISFVKIRIPVSLFDLKQMEPATPAPALEHSATKPLAIMHPPSGFVGVLNPAKPKVWPDTMFVFDFQRNAGESPIIVNPVSGALREAGIDVRHRFEELVIERRNPADGTFSPLPDVRASWLLNAAGGGVGLSSRLAIPCNDPLVWLQRYDYAQPDSNDRVDAYRLQTFGIGPARLYPVQPSGRASARFEDIEVSASLDFWLAAVPWDRDYARALAMQTMQIDFSSLSATGRTLLATDWCELRVLGPEATPPKFWIDNGTATQPLLVRAQDGKAEWSVAVQREPDEAGLPLIVYSESTHLIAAIGYRTARTFVNPVPDTQILAPGRYRVRTAGNSTASFRGTSAPESGTWRVEREFEVVPPPLRPYLRYSTLGDERLFGLEAGGWNPNPVGHGFGHYPEHLGQIRASVGYLDRIYPTVFVRTDEDASETLYAVRDCLQGTLAGPKASQDWRTDMGQTPAIEDELSFEVAEAAGLHQLTVKRLAADGVGPGDIIDEWTYRVSRYTSAAAHLGVGCLLRHAIGPFGTRSLSSTGGTAPPPGFDLDAVTIAAVGGDWALPALVSGFVGIESAQAGLSFLQALEWCGVFAAPVYPLDLGPFARPEKPDLCLVMDRAEAPVALLLRTAEPCDWRRIEVVAATCFDNAAARRFSVKLIPSPDGCQCLLILMAEGVPVRVPRGAMMLRLRFKLEAEGLPRLTRIADPGQTAEEVVTFFNQPLGAAWWEA
jgi:hypothetical protein